MPKSTPLMANQSQVEKHARALCVELARTTDGQPMQWRMVAPIAAAVGLDDASAAIAYGVRRGWLLAEGQPPHSICLTDAGRVWTARLVK